MTLDYVDTIRLEDDSVTRFHNQLQVLDAWRHGLHFLYTQMLLTESLQLKKMASQFSDQASDPTTPPGLCFSNLGCCFQWYAVTFCNYVELVGSLAWSTDQTQETIQKYRQRVSGAALHYRNLVAAHVAETRRNQSNAAEKFASLIPPSGFSNLDGRFRFYASSWRVSMRSSGTSSSSDKLQQWSLTAMHEANADRYWPGVPDNIRKQLKLDDQQPTPRSDESE